MGKKKLLSHLYVLRMVSAFGVLASGTAAWADTPSRLVIGGSQASASDSYTYAGVILPMGGASLGQGLYFKTITSLLSYQYITNQGAGDIEVKARAPGIETGAGYAWKIGDLAMDLSASVGYRNVRVSPIVPSGERIGSILTFNPQLQASYAVTKSIEAGLIASYAFGQRSTFARARLGWKGSGSWSVGLQETYLHGRNYRTSQHGLYLLKYLDNGLTIELTGGTSRPHNNEGSAFFGLGLAKVF